MKSPDLSTRRNGIAAAPSSPVFSRRNANPTGTLAFAAAGTQSLYAAPGSVTVLWIMLQVRSAATIQILKNGEVLSLPYICNGGSILHYCGMLLLGNERLSITSSAAVSIDYEMAVVKEHDERLIVTDIYFWNPAGVVLADAPTGLESGMVVRTIARKKSSTETITPLIANGVYTGPWHDTQVDGTLYVNVWALSNQASTSGGFVLQESDDIANASFTRSIISVQALANTLKRLGAQIKARYWRVFYTNGPTLQTTFEITYCAFNYLVMPDAATTLANADVSQAVVVSTTPVNGAVTVTDNAATVNFLAASGLPTPVLEQMYGGKFSGTASPALQGALYARTPTIFKQVSTAATGSTAIWTPAASNKFRLLGWRIQVTALAKAAVAADLVIKLLDVAADLGQGTLCTIPVAAAGNGVILDTGWVSLGQFGVLSAAANNALNLNLSFALTGGLVNCNVLGVEE